MKARIPCAACGVNPSFKQREHWRIVSIKRLTGDAGPALDEGLRVLCGDCLSPLRIKFIKQSKAS